jgi:hypothetical protein
LFILFQKIEITYWLFVKQQPTNITHQAWTIKQSELLSDSSEKTI